jgi:hypothetical protein
VLGIQDLDFEWTGSLRLVYKHVPFGCPSALVALDDRYGLRGDICMRDERMGCELGVFFGGGVGSWAAETQSLRMCGRGSQQGLHSCLGLLCDSCCP